MADLATVEPAKPGTLTTLRASQMDLAMVCPGSVYGFEGEIAIDPVNPEAAKGSAAHQLYRMMVEHNWDYIPPDEVVKVAGHWNVTDLDDLSFLANAGAKIWREHLRQYCEGVQQWEEEFCTDLVKGGLALTGHPDLYIVNDDGTVFVPDWKTGRLTDEPHYHQMAAYALMLKREVAMGNITTAPIMVRDSTWSPRTWTKEEVEDWAGQVVAKVVHWDGAYHPGPLCNRCRWKHCCPADHAVYDATLRLLVADDPHAIAKTKPDLVLVGRAMQARLKTLLDDIRAEVIEHGPICDGGQELYVQTSEEDVIDAEKGWPVMQAAIGDAGMATVVKIGKTALTKAAAAGAPRGKKGKAGKELMAALGEVGAIRKKTKRQLKVRKIQEQTDE